MTAGELVAYALLGLGVAMEVIACVGVVMMRGVYDRIHFLAPSVLGAILVAAAVWVREGPSIISLQATLLSGFLVVASPALAHATARAARISERGDWRRKPSDAIELEER